MEVEMKLSQSISLGNQHEFLLAGDVGETDGLEESIGQGGTLSQVQSITVTALVGDIGNYSALVQKVEPVKLQQAIRRVFHRLENEVIELGGTVKEFRGDAIFAYWEELLSENMAVDACSAAIRLSQLGRELAVDTSVWDIPEFPLRMEWALATGSVTIDTIGDDRPTGLTMVGRPVVLAFRLEKFAREDTCPIVVCSDTYEKALLGFEFSDLGEKSVKGFDEPVRVYALKGPR
jgi:class 3 adenylate cyclase